MASPVEHVSTMENHWQWSPGWHPGRHFYAVHLPMGGHSDLVALAQGYQTSLRPFSGLDLIPALWLHLSMQGVGFVDSVTAAEIRALETGLREGLGPLPTPVVTFHRPVVRPTAVYLPAVPAEPLAAVRDVVRATIADVLGPERVELAPQHVAGYRPHMSVAYSSASQSAEPIVAALSGIDPPSVSVSIGSVALMVYHRDDRMYQWTQATEIQIGG